MVLNSVKLKKDGYIHFDTPETFVNGNVVIVAIDKELNYDQIEADADNRILNAEVLWSWNIVFSEGYDPDAAENCIVKGGYTFMGRNLGAVIDWSQADIKPNQQQESVNLAWTSGNCYPRWTEVLLKHGAERRITRLSAIRRRRSPSTSTRRSERVMCRRMHSTWAGPTPTSGFTRMKIT